MFRRVGRTVLPAMGVNVELGGGECLGGSYWGRLSMLHMGSGEGNGPGITKDQRRFRDCSQALVVETTY
jgi:hypothetical protein